MEGLIFPRAAALAERLWTNPEEGYLQAESRMFLHRERLVRHGVRAMAITPTFCLQNQEACFGQGEDDEKV
jgi:hexosaminidase